MESKYFYISETPDKRFISLIPKEKYCKSLSTITLYLMDGESFIVAKQHTANPTTNDHFEQELIFIKSPNQEAITYIIIDEPELFRARVIFSNTLDF